jgi:hypothetical protein
MEADRRQGTVEESVRILPHMSNEDKILLAFAWFFACFVMSLLLTVYYLTREKK